MPELIINQIQDTGQAAAMIRDLAERGFSIVANHQDGHWSITARSAQQDQLSAIAQLVQDYFPREAHHAAT
jgi:hypothetical protein